MVLFPTYIHIVRTMAKSQKRSDKNEVKSFVGMALACLHALYFYPMYLLVFFASSSSSCRLFVSRSLFRRTTHKAPIHTFIRKGEKKSNQWKKNERKIGTRCETVLRGGNESQVENFAMYEINRTNKCI